MAQPEITSTGSIFNFGDILLILDPKRRHMVALILFEVGIEFGMFRHIFALIGQIYFYFERRSRQILLTLGVLQFDGLKFLIDVVLRSKRTIFCFHA